MGDEYDEPDATADYFSYALRLEAYRQDAKETCNDVKFSPSNQRIAMGSNDNFIYVYNCELVAPGADSKKYAPPGVRLQLFHRLAGHSSYITHLGKLHARLFLVIVLTSFVRETTTEQSGGGLHLLSKSNPVTG